MKVLVLEPYYGGSHKLFLDSLAIFVEADYHFMTLPARKWKMRMQLSAPWFVQCIKELKEEERKFDVVLCSTFIDAAVFKAMAWTITGWNQNAKIVIYYHENQFAYPNQEEAPNNYQFNSINFNSAVVADSLAFNSKFNKRTFLAGCKKYIKSAADMKLTQCYDELVNKSRVLHLGLNFDALDKIQRKESTDKTIKIIWNHRWEHDKNPDEFFDALRALKKRGVRFKLIVLGESFRDIPDCFIQAERDFEENMIHFGFAENRETYRQLLKSADIVVSTAFHEFFGISVIEAVRAGCFPILPQRLSYPELFDKKDYFYKEGKLDRTLENLIRNYRRLEDVEIKRLTEKYSWPNISGDYKQWLLNDSQ